MSTRTAPALGSKLTSFVAQVLAQTGWRGRGVDFALGAVSVLSLAPFHMWVFMLLALAALSYRIGLIPALSDTPKRRAFGRGFWFGLGYFLCGTYWIGSAFIARGPEFYAIMPPMILGLAVLLSLFWGAAALLLYKLSPPSGARPMVFAACFTLFEFLRGHILTGFPWNLPGYIFEAGGAVSQSASVIGIYGLTFIVFLLGGLIARLRRGALYAGLILAVLFASGFMRLSSASLQTVPDVRLRIVQVPFSQADQFDPVKSTDIVNRYLTNSIAPGLDNVTHVIWPEGAVSGLAIENEPLVYAMGAALLSQTQTPPIWLLNSLRQETRPHPSLDGQIIKDYFNSSVAITFTNEGVPAVAAFNDKSKLVPFGEFVPFGKWLESQNFGPLSTAVTSMTPAPGKDLSTFPGVPRLSPQICYEIIFSGLTPRPQNNDAQWILNQSNDAWYGRSIGPYQHANQARYRAIEEGLPIIRAAANGLSGQIDPYGRWGLTQPKIDDSGVIDVNLYQALTKTAFRPVFSLLILLICAAICLFYARGASSRLRRDTFYN
ncbi:apolipoprotein N-acyltransferase [Fretibacter rubidus]|uniref:apolipoprotein N-acyltransferase n=1 Tax=Fretibacter rubidus TaxID=570162 RepID=UPI00352B1AEF